jgi:hypothetical protein
MKTAALILALAVAAPAAAQTQKPQAADPQREAAVKRCKENRGYNCETEDGLREWLRQEQPLTPEQQSAAAGARKHREACAKNPKGQGC